MNETLSLSLIHRGRIEYVLILILFWTIAFGFQLWKGIDRSFFTAATEVLSQLKFPGFFM